MPDAIAKLTLSIPYNDLTAVEAALRAHPEQVAAIILEPVAGNMGCVPPEPGYLAGLRRLCDEHGTLLIVDEVMTGFRVGPRGALGRYDVAADLCCLGKIIGGGLPVGAYGGRRDLMSQMAPAGPVYQAGTLSGNPLAVAAGQAMLEMLSDDVYVGLEQQGAKLQAGIEALIAKHGGGARVQRVGAMFCVYFRDEPVKSLEDARACDTDRFGRVFHELLNQGIWLAPSAFEAGFLSAAHDEEAIDQTLAAWDVALGVG